MRSIEEIDKEIEELSEKIRVLEDKDDKLFRELREVEKQELKHFDHTYVKINENDVIMQFEKYIWDYIAFNGSDTLFRDGIEQSTFVVAAEMVCQIVERAGGHDFHEAVADTYRKLFEVVLRPMFDNQGKLMKALENQMKYGTRITITTEQMEKLLEETKNGETKIL